MSMMAVRSSPSQAPRRSASAAKASSIRSITGPDRQAGALAQVARALAGAGQHEQAARVARQAEAVARSITDPDPHAGALAQVAGALAGAGQHEQAEAVARSITSPDRQAGALARVARALAGAGHAAETGREDKTPGHDGNPSPLTESNRRPRTPVVEPGW